MKLLLQSAMIFFGTLLAAALLALGEPSGGQADAGRFMTGAAGPLQQAAWQQRTEAEQVSR